MKKKLSTLCAALLTTLALAAVTHALPSQTFVSSTGNDANDCTQPSPCRTFAGAVLKTSAKGIITALDSSVYGIVTIDRAITIQAAPGVSAVLEGGRTDDVVTINAGTTSVVALRNLQIMTRSVAANQGVLINAVGTLHVENCIITGFGGVGILGPDHCYETGCTQVFVLDTVFRGNVTGMKLGSVTALVDHCRFDHNHTGIQVVAQADVTIRDSVLAGSSDVALKAQIFGNARVENCVVTNNGTGIQGESVNGGGQNVYRSGVSVSSTMIVSNETGLAANGGLIFSLGNNRLFANHTDGAFTDTILQQ
jgi:hypothetical protein